MSLPSALAILGPTASGKTRLALQLAEYLPIEIISLDSALVYQGMDIGTAKPTAYEMASVPHHLIDIISPMQAYSAADFVNDTVRLIDEIHQRQRYPIIVGGTMMYYQALKQGLNQLPSADVRVRAQLAQDKQQHGLASLYQRLQEVDPTTAARLNANDSQRIERALEVYLITGQSMSQYLQEHHVAPELNVHTISLMPQERAHLHANIALRFENMLANGFIEEVEQLRQQYPDLHADLPSMRCVGYRQAWDYLEGACDFEQMQESGIIATRQLAKRQMTWLRKITSEHIIDPYASQNMLQTVLPIVKKHFEA